MADRGCTLTPKGREKLEGRIEELIVRTDNNLTKRNAPALKTYCDLQGSPAPSINTIHFILSGRGVDRGSIKSLFKCVDLPFENGDCEKRLSTSDQDGSLDRIDYFAEDDENLVHQETEDESSSESNVDLVPKYIPHSGVEEEGFFGRDTLLDQLQTEICKEGARIALSGIGGVGKTEIAIQLARRYGDFFSGGICWISVFEGYLPDPEPAQRRVASAIASFATTYLDIQIPPRLLLSAKDQARYCLRNWKSGNVLIIFDDVQSYEDIGEYLALLQEETRFRLILTSRNRDFGSHVQLISLNELNSDASLDFLSYLVKNGRVNKESPEAKDLCDRLLGNLPLGIELIGKFIDNSPELSVGDVRETLKSRSEDMELPEYPGFDDPGRSATAKRGLIAAFDLTWAALRDDTRFLGRILGRFAPTEIQWELIQELREEVIKNRPELKKYWLDELRKARQQLIAYNLLKASDSEQLIYQMHPLVWEYFRYKQEARSKEVMSEEVEKQSESSVTMMS